MIVLVTGGRDYGTDIDIERLYDALYTIHGQTPITVLVHGYARGADSIAREWGEGRRQMGQDVSVMGFRADWDLQHHCKGHRHTRLGAGHCRNGRMIAWVVAQPGTDKLVLACPGGRGTADCVRQAKAAGLVVKTLDDVLEPPLLAKMGGS